MKGPDSFLARFGLIGEIMRRNFRQSALFLCVIGEIFRSFPYEHPETHQKMKYFIARRAEWERLSILGQSQEPAILVVCGDAG